MTDTVNGLRPIVGIENRTAQEVFDIMSDRVRAMLAAAPKAEPVRWQPIDTAPKDGTHIDVWREEGGLDTVFWGFPHHECGEMGQYCDSDWHSIQAPGWVCSTFHEFLGCSFNPFTHWKPVDAGPHGQPEAPKVEQGVVGYLEGAAIADLRNGFASVTATVYSKAESGCEAIYTHPAPASDELLEALEAVRKALVPCGVLNDNVRKALTTATRAIAQHKGPQS